MSLTGPPRNSRRLTRPPGRRHAGLGVVSFSAGIVPGNPRYDAISKARPGGTPPGGLPPPAAIWLNEPTRTTPGARNFVGSLRFDGLTQTLQQPLQWNLIPARGMTVQAWCWNLPKLNVDGSSPFTRFHPNRVESRTCGISRIGSGLRLSLHVSNPASKAETRSRSPSPQAEQPLRIQDPAPQGEPLRAQLRG